MYYYTVFIIEVLKPVDEPSIVNCQKLELSSKELCDHMQGLPEPGDKVTHRKFNQDSGQLKATAFEGGDQYTTILEYYAK